MQTFSSFLEKNYKKFGENYENLFEPACGYPVVNSKKKLWSLEKKLKKEVDKLDYFNDLAGLIVQNAQDVVMIPNVDKFVMKFNAEWTKVRLKPNHVVEEGVKEILFNFKSKDYSWLSNMFGTLIYSEKPLPFIYFGIESAYKAYKAHLIGASGLEVLSIAQLVDMSQAQKIKGLSPAPEIRIKIMQELVHLKFKQNRILEKKLIDTKDAELVEHTKNEFWADGAEGKSVVRGKTGKNHLGQILMYERDPNHPFLPSENKE